MSTTAPPKTAKNQPPVKTGRKRGPISPAQLRETASARPFGPIQAKLTVGPARDRFEVEADRVADRVMHMPDSSSTDHASPPEGPRLGRAGISRVQAMFAVRPESDLTQPAWYCAGCAKEAKTGGTPEHKKDEDLQRKPRGQTSGGTSELNGPLEAGVRSLQAGGQALPPAERRYFEPRFATSFADVRVHADERADRLTRAMSAEAFTLGRHVVFRNGRYAPGTTEGRRLMAHELTHVVQQTGASPPMGGQVQRTIGDGHDLSAPRFSGNVILEAAFDDERLIRNGASGEHVRLIQESLVAMGYALPNSVSAANPTQLDGDFGDETEAAIRQFQIDAGAVEIDGIVGDETMGLLDTHDVSQPAARPPAIIGPVAAPLGASGCDQHFTGVTFALANQAASSVASPATFTIATVGGDDFLAMRGNTPIDYQPEVTITAPTNADAANFRVGFVQNLLTSHRVAAYSAGAQVSTVVPTLPIKDGAPTDYNPIFVTNLNATIVEDFAATGQTVHLRWPDVPSDGNFIDLLDNPSCAGSGLAAQTMESMFMLDTFRTWVVVQHRPSGCVRSLHHVDWHLSWLALITAGPTVTTVINMNIVTEPNGDGTPGFIQGGDVPGQIAVKQCT